MNNTFNTLFHLKKPKNYVKRPIPIYIRVTVDGSCFEITTNRGCEPGNWNTAKGRVAGYKEETKLLNNYLDLLRVENPEKLTT